MLQCKTVSGIADIPAALWDGLFAATNPFIRHAFLLALESSGCAGVGAGWQPQHLLFSQGGKPLAAMPLYLKYNSYGEFVFDWGWADAFARHGLEYYPKLVTAVPFSPVAGPRVGIAQGHASTDIYRMIFETVRSLADAASCSSWHLLFPDGAQQQALEAIVDERSFVHREAVQFHWFNQGYQSFDEFLATFRSARRKNIRRERRKVAEQGIRLERKVGADINQRDWQGFYRCYTNTYQKRSGHSGYLNPEFFEQLRQNMGDKLMLVTANAEGDLLASSLFLFDQQCLYGRYWGALQDVSCLHFESCYYQGIEFCIERGLSSFDPGTQGEHKLLRGFEPIKSVSYHWIAEQRFATAIADFLKRENHATDEYQRQAKSYLPYRKGPGQSSH